jgi:hypothetical protein
VINPITWNARARPCRQAEGLGSIMPDPTTHAFVPVPQYADARVDAATGVLICTTPTRTVYTN